MTDPAPDIHLSVAADGAVTYVIGAAPGDLPSVRRRDLLAAWDAARQAAQCAAWGTARAFRFARSDGGWTVLALHDPDAQCWAGAVDGVVGLQTRYGISVCLRLLALIDLLREADWTRALLSVDRREANIHPALLKLAAEARLTDDARFDETGLRACLQTELPVFQPAGAMKP